MASSIFRRRDSTLSQLILRLSTIRIPWSSGKYTRMSASTVATVCNMMTPSLRQRQRRDSSIWRGTAKSPIETTTGARITPRYSEGEHLVTVLLITSSPELQALTTCVILQLLEISTTLQLTFSMETNSMIPWWATGHFHRVRDMARCKGTHTVVSSVEIDFTRVKPIGIRITRYKRNRAWSAPRIWNRSRQMLFWRTSSAQLSQK